MDVRKSMAHVLVFAAWMSVSVLANAQRPADLRGAGGIGCGEYLQDRKNDQHSQYYSQWVQGFLFGYNFYGKHPQTTSIPDSPTVHAYLEKHCRDNPLDGVARAAMFLIGDLNGLRLTK